MLHCDKKNSQGEGYWFHWWFELKNVGLYYNYLILRLILVIISKEELTFPRNVLVNNYLFFYLMIYVTYYD